MNRYARQGGSAFQRPENALKRAEELQRVGQKTAAVLALHDVLTSRRHRAWIKGLEDIVYRFIDLCVEERMGRYAKEALMQYRNTCQNVNINSLEEVIKYFLKKATERAEEAQAKADVRPSVPVRVKLSTTAYNYCFDIGDCVLDRERWAPRQLAAFVLSSHSYLLNSCTTQESSKRIFTFRSMMFGLTRQRIRWRSPMCRADHLNQRLHTRFFLFSLRASQVNQNHQW
jgi:hypothetical protein